MTRLSLLQAVLLGALIVASLLLVKNAYEVRRLVARLHVAEQEGMRLDGETARLQAERQAQATTATVERSARDRLGMRPLSPAVTMVEGRAASAPLMSASAAAVAAPRATRSPALSPAARGASR